MDFLRSRRQTYGGVGRRASHCTRLVEPLTRIMARFSSCYRSTAASLRQFLGACRSERSTLAEREDISRGIASGFVDS